MKAKLLYILVIFGMLSSGCLSINENTYDEYILVDVYKPVYQSLEEFRANSIEITDPIPIERTGKIYVYKNYLFVNDMEKGIHIIDNSDPKNPKKIKFIGVKGSSEIEVKGNFLYTNNYMDLVVFDLLDIFNIKYKARAKEVFLSTVPYNENGVITDYKIVKEWVKKDDDRLYYNDGIYFSEVSNLSGTKATANSVGQGGSLARFKIVNNFLYAVDYSSIDVFSLEDLSAPKKLDRVKVGFGIETIFNSGNHLFLGSQDGMYVYNIDVPSKPTYVSDIRHVRSCDPVVVDGNFAYVTLRGGSACAGFKNSLDIIDIADLAKPTLIKQYDLVSPYGLGIKNNLLFICDGAAGLKVFDKTDNLNLKLLDTFPNVNAFDVIPLENSLVMIASKKVFQFKYSKNGLDLLSEFSLD